MIKNTAKTFVLLAALGGLLMGAGALMGGRGGLAVGLVIGLLMVGASFWFSDSLAVKAARAVEVSEQDAPRLHAIVHDLTVRAGMPMPRLYVAPSEQPNAFATGRSPDRSAVAVTQGILKLLSEDELRGVIAHELAHIRNRDTLTMTITATLAGAISMLAQFGRSAEAYDQSAIDREIQRWQFNQLAPWQAEQARLAMLAADYGGRTATTSNTAAGAGSETAEGTSQGLLSGLFGNMTSAFGGGFGGRVGGRAGYLPF